MSSSSFRLRGFVAVAAVLALAGAAEAAGDGEHGRAEDRFPVPRGPRTMRMQTGADARQVVFVNGGGATLRGGWDDAARGISSVVYGRGLDEVEVPAWSQGEEAWRETVACVRANLAPFAIDVVDERPAAGPFIMALVGGDSSQLGYGATVGGIAPYNGSVLPTAIVFTFERTLHPGVSGACEVTTHEIGHALGLDHIYLCEDPMTYLHGCGKKTFQDRDAACGEYEERECANGATTQNSYRRLGAALGFTARRDAEPEPKPEPKPEPESEPEAEAESEPEPEPEPEPESESESEPEPEFDSGCEHPPEIEIVTPDTGDEFAEGTTLTIAIRATDADGVATMELGWEHTDTIYVCDDLPEDAPVTCARTGDLFVYTLRVGAGTRRFAARATDAKGNQTVTEIRTLSFR